MVIDPSISAFDANHDRAASLAHLMGQKERLEFTKPGVGDRTVLHFPGCFVGGSQGKGRTLGQIASAAQFTEPQREIGFKRFWRSSVVFSRDVFEVRISKNPVNVSEKHPCCALLGSTPSSTRVAAMFDYLSKGLTV